MKLVRAVAILVGLADLAFAAWFLVGGQSMPGVDDAVYTRWVGMCSLTSAALLFMTVSDPERYFSVLFVNTGGRALAVIVGLPAAFSSGHILAVVISEGALAAVVVLVIIHAIKERRAEAGDGEGDAKPVVKAVAKSDAKPGKKSAKKPDKKPDKA